METEHMLRFLAPHNQDMAGTLICLLLTICLQQMTQGHLCIHDEVLFAYNPYKIYVSVHAPACYRILERKCR